MVMWRRLGAEFFGTFWLTFAGCGSAVLAAGFPSLGIGFLGVSLAFGLTVLTMAYAVGHVSGGHFNCAVTIGLWAGGRFKATDVLPYILTQVAGAIVAAAVLYVIASGKPEWVPGGFASNGYGDLSPGNPALQSMSSKGVWRRIFEAMFDDSDFEYRIVSDKSGVAAASAKQLGLRLLNELHRSGRRR
jgi:aquaporin Z